MMKFFLKSVAKIILLAVVAVQVFGGILVFQPMEAQASTPAKSFSDKLSGAVGAIKTKVSVPSATTFDWHKFLADVFTQVMLGIAYAFAQKFMQRFVSKLTEKYKIRNFLYYDQILTNYYLSNFIRDKITDPDLREIYVLLEAGYITGQPTGRTGGPDPNAALIPRFKRAVTNLYIKETGVDPVMLQNPPAGISNQDYLANARFFFGYNPSYVESNLRARFGEFQSGATTAAQLEVLVGNGLKAGRFVGGRCFIAGQFVETRGTSSKIDTPETCRSKGGEWKESALDQARSFIDNPTAYVDKWMNGVVLQLTGSNLDPNNFWFTIGNAFGRFLYNQLLIDKREGVLNEDPRGYEPAPDDWAAGTLDVVQEIDIDGDGVGDGYDNDGDGILDYCVYGGTAPNCQGSRTALSGGVGACADLYADVGSGSKMSVVSGAMDAVLSDSSIANLPLNEANKEFFTEQVAEYLNGQGEEALNGYNGGCNRNPGNLAIKTSDVTGELYALTRDGLDCDDRSEAQGATIQSAAKCRPQGDAVYSAPWVTLSTGQRP